MGMRVNWALSMFYIVYPLVKVPSNIILKRVGPRFYLPFLVCGFGLVSLCTAFVRSFEAFMVARVFLGIFEGGAMPRRNGTQAHVCVAPKHQPNARSSGEVSAAFPASILTGARFERGRSRKCHEPTIKADPVGRWRRMPSQSCR